MKELGEGQRDFSIKRNNINDHTFPHHRSTCLKTEELKEQNQRDFVVE
jgi:hypothetical protein